MIVEFIRNGRRKSMHPKLARLLEKQGYVRLSDTGVKTEISEKPVGAVVSSGIEAMTRDELRAMADGMGIKVHHLAGEEKLRAAIRAAM